MESSSEDELADDLYDHIKKTQIDDIILQSLLSFITIWAVQNRITFSAIDELLDNHGIKCHRTGRTLLKTNKLP